jgi:hypothetical protein
MAKIHTSIAVVVATLCCWTGTSFAQTEAQCQQGFAVKSGKSVTYIAVNANGQFKAPATMTCNEAEAFRERLYISMDKGIYDSEVILKGKLATSKAALDKLEQELQTAVDAVTIKAKIAAATVIVYTPAAIASTAACVSAVIDGFGIVACGPAVKNSLAATSGWIALTSFAGDVATLKAKAQAEIQKNKTALAAITQQLDATKAKNIKEYYSNLFVAICRAVREQCL